MDHTSKLDLLRRTDALAEYILSNPAFPDYPDQFKTWRERIAREVASDAMRENPVLREVALTSRTAIATVNKELVERRGMEREERDRIMERRDTMMQFAQMINPMEDTLADIERTVSETEAQHAV